MNKNVILIILAPIILGALGYLAATKRPATDGTVIQPPPMQSPPFLPTPSLVLPTPSPVQSPPSQDIELPPFNTYVLEPYSAPRLLSLGATGLYTYGYESSYQSEARSRKVLKLIERNGFTKIILFPDDREVCCFKWSPDGSQIFFLHHKREPGEQTYFYGPPPYGLSLINTQGTPAIRELMPEIKNRFIVGSPELSPDSRYIAYLRILSYPNLPESSIEVREVRTNNIVAQIKLEIPPQLSITNGISLPTWLSDNRLSFILNGNLYVGTLANPKERLIAQDAISVVGVFDKRDHDFVSRLVKRAFANGGPATLKPHWSSDGRYVSYPSTQGYKVLDTVTSQQFILGGVCRYDCIPPSFDLEESVGIHGWVGSKLFYFKNFLIMFIEMPSGRISEYYNTGLIFSRALSKDAKYLVFAEQSRSNFTIYNLDTKREVCGNLSESFKFEWLHRSGGVSFVWSDKNPSTLFALKNIIDHRGISQVGYDPIGPEEIIAIDVSACRIVGTLRLQLPPLENFLYRDSLNWNWQVFPE